MIAEPNLLSVKVRQPTINILEAEINTLHQTYYRLVIQSHANEHLSFLYFQQIIVHKCKNIHFLSHINCI